MNSVQFVLGIIATCILSALLLWQYKSERAKRADQGRVLFEPVLPLFDAADLRRGEAAGVWMLTGRFRNHHFQLKTVADTLATRKLPSLWLLVTLPEPQAVSATTDMMMRAAGVSSFSNFDFLPHTLERPEGFPEQATLRSDVADSTAVLALMAKHLDVFHGGRGKEFLISPVGLRIVVQLAEGDRARYGVFREANFAGTEIETGLATGLMETLINLRNDIHDHAKT